MASSMTFEAIGTRWIIDIPLSSHTEEVENAVRTRIEAFDKVYSRFREDSLVTEISQRAGTYTMPEDFEPMITLYKELYDITGGLMTPLVGQLLSDLGYDKEYSFARKEDPLPSPKWEDCISWESPRLVVKKPILLDFGAIGKGYLIDMVGQILEAQSISSYTIDAGGDILHKGSPIRIGLENPRNPNEVIGVTEIENGSICGSSGNRRTWANIHHIVDPIKMTSPSHIEALWVTSTSAMLSDALSTALFFTTAKNLTQRYTFEYLLLKPDFSIEKSDNFSGDIFYT
jgi:FAD:protein FMN transferase